MKYGLIVYKETDNLGDDIQSFAARRFLPRVDYYIDRENLDEFASDDYVSAIMNGWYMRNKYHWPPSNSLNPLLVSMHFTTGDDYGVGDAYLDGLGGEYLKRFEPIGARDINTLELLKQKGIDSYFSGCMTLTISLDGEIKKTNEVIMVDVEKSLMTSIRDANPAQNFVETTHYVDEDNNPKVSMEERFRRVELQLRMYRNAKCVITERLHVALPCLALGTPVLLIYRKENSDRMESFLPLLHTATPREIMSGVYNFDISNPPDNPEGYLQIRDNLERKCMDFIASCEKGIINEPVCFTKHEIKLWKRQIVRAAVYKRRLVFRDNTTIGRLLYKLYKKTVLAWRRDL